MSEELSESDKQYQLVIKAIPVDDQAKQLFEEYFSDHDVIHSQAFTGTELVAALGLFTERAIQHLLTWFRAHQDRLKDATIEIGKEKVLLKGYTLSDATEFLNSNVVSKLLKDLKQP